MIDIDDNLYTRLFDTGDEYVADMRRACVAIRKGTPLPKGHGSLVDYDEMKKIAFDYGRYTESALSYIKPRVLIEADKAESEDKE